MDYCSYSYVPPTHPQTWAPSKDQLLLAKLGLCRVFGLSLISSDDSLHLPYDIRPLVAPCMMVEKEKRSGSGTIVDGVLRTLFCRFPQLNSISTYSQLEQFVITNKTAIGPFLQPIVHMRPSLPFQQPPAQCTYVPPPCPAQPAYGYPYSR